MPAIINTNVMSLNAQRNLNTSQGLLAESLQRLSSGLRINSAKDDAAGLAIATRFTTQIRGLNQAVRNANDGISLSQTGESALGEVTNNLQRIRELAVQSVNATNSASDRLALDAEVQQRLADINRIASQTSFNGKKVLDGSFGTAAFQVGANVGETVAVNFSTGIGANQIGQIATAAGTQVTDQILTEGGLTIQVGNEDAVAVGQSVAGTANGQSANSAYAKAEAIRTAGISGLTVTAENAQTIDFTSVATVTDYNLEINGVAIYENYNSVDDGSGNAQPLNGAAVADQINLNASTTGVRASFAGGALTLTTVDGRDINIVEAKDVATAEGLTDQDNVDNTGATIDFQAAAVTASFSGTITLSAGNIISLDGDDELEIGFTDAQSIAVDSTTLAEVDVTTVANANETILRVDAALQTVSSVRSEFGAVQQRFESTIVNLQTISENLSASRSRIEDADFAAETAKLTKAQILQQAGVAVLAQANAVPQTVLGLLR
jgi:flagellin